MTPRQAYEEIWKRFPGLCKTSIFKMGYRGNTLTLSGSEIALDAMDKAVMQALYPTYCRPPEKIKENGNMSYRYKFN